MAKQVKSIRVDDSIMNVFTKYAELTNELFGNGKPSFGSFVNEALAKELMNITSMWVNTMENQAVVERLPNGKLKRYSFSSEQVEKMRALEEHATAAYGAYLADNEE